MGRDWARERWRKQYIREPLQEQLWPVMARGLRELLNMLAEEDGSLVSDVDDPEDALVTVLGARAPETELVRAAIALLVEQGFLENDGRSIRIPELPVAQAPKASSHNTAFDDPQHTSRKTSTDRVRRHRARLRARLEAERAGNVAPVGPPVSAAYASVSSSVSPAPEETFQPSRGERDQDPSHKSDRKINTQIDLPLHHRARESRNVSVQRTTLHERAEDDDEDEGSFSMSVSEVERARALPIQERASLILERPALGRVLHPERWPEVVAVAGALAESCGLGAGYLGTYDADEGVRAVVKLFAAGIPQTSLEFVARTVPKQHWWNEKGKRLGLSSLTLEVVRRNMPGPDGRARVAPGVAKAIAAVRDELARNSA